MQINIRIGTKIVLQNYFYEKIKLVLMLLFHDLFAKIRDYPFKFKELVCVVCALYSC